MTKQERDELRPYVQNLFDVALKYCNTHSSFPLFCKLILQLMDQLDDYERRIPSPL